jgi:ribosomal protein S18 acetylase RimI-like enzyme
MNAAKAAAVTFRIVTGADEPVLLKMMRNLAEQEPGAYFFNEPLVREALHKFLADANLGEAWIVCDGDIPAGYVVLTFGFSFEFHGRDAFIDELYIEPAYRRRGLGRRAMDFIAKRARECGVNAIHHEVDEGNIAAEELYRRVGYADHSRFLMTKCLNQA